MNQEWVDQEIKRCNKRVDQAKIEIVEQLKNQVLISPAYKEKLLTIVAKSEWTYGERYEFELLRIFGFYKDIFDEEAMGGQTYKDNEEYKLFCKWAAHLNKLAETIYNSQTYDTEETITCRYLDSEPREFEGDIIITDPCYITKDLDTSTEPRWEDYCSFKTRDQYPDYDPKKKHSEMYEAEWSKYKNDNGQWWKDHPSDWDICRYGQNMGALGLKHYICRGTIYGDWSCHTFNQDTKEPIGEFCADAGLVAVFQLDEVLKYNPDFDDHINRTWTTTWIKDFKGKVWFTVEEETGVYEDDTEYHKKGDTWREFNVHVVGEGINMETGEPIRFITSQTGL